MASTRVVVADRNRLIRDLVTRACCGRGLDVVGEVADLDELVGMTDTLSSAVVVVSDPLAGQSIDDAVEKMAAGGAGVLVLSDDASPDRVLGLLGRGAAGYVMHDMKADQIADGVVEVSRGGAVLPPRIASLVLAEWRQLRSEDSPQFSLTPRERDVLGAMVEGMSTKAIARHLGVALKTVESHKLRLFDKLGARNQAHAVSIAMGHGLVSTTAEGAS